MVVGAGLAVTEQAWKFGTAVGHSIFEGGKREVLSLV